MAITKQKFGAVLLLDALGAGRLDVEGSTQFLKVSQTFRESLRSVMDSISKHGEFLDHETRPVEMHAFGDSVFFAWEAGAAPDGQYPITDALAMASVASTVGLAWAVRKGTLFRGALTVGNYVTDGEVAIGPAAADAAYWYEEPKAALVILTPQAATQWEAALESDKVGTSKQVLADAFTEFVVPLKRVGDKRMWTIPWPRHFSVQVETDEKEEAAPRQVLLEIFEKMEAPPKAGVILLNTVKYFDEVMRRFPLDKIAMDAHDSGMRDAEALMRMESGEHDDEHEASGLEQLKPDRS